MIRSCKFFEAGQCRNGDSCRFVHAVRSPVLAPTGVSNGFTPPMMINIPEGVPIFSIDVECAAISVGHNGRAVCSIGMVDALCQPLARVLVKEDPDKPVVSYLENLTGVKRKDVEENGIPFADAVAIIRSHLGPDAVLVGQNVLKDIHWLGLKEGVDYKFVIDLAILFRVWNIKRQSWTNFSQDHVAQVWLSIYGRSTHDCLEDASISMALFNAYRTVQWNPQQLHFMQMNTLNAPREPSLAATLGSIEGCCLGHRKTCICGEAFFVS